MPNVERLVDEGVMGQIATLQPPLSLLCFGPPLPRGNDRLSMGSTVSPNPPPTAWACSRSPTSLRRCKAVWNILNQNGCPQYRDRMVAKPSRRNRFVGVTVSDHYHRVARTFGEWLAHAAREQLHPPGTGRYACRASSCTPRKLLWAPCCSAFVPQAAGNRPKKRPASDRLSPGTLW